MCVDIYIGKETKGITFKLSAYFQFYTYLNESYSCNIACRLVNVGQCGMGKLFLE